MNEINEYVRIVYEQPIFQVLEKDDKEYWLMSELLYTDDFLDYWLVCLVLADNNVYQAEHFYINYEVKEVYDKYLYRLAFNNREAKNGRF